ncbi:hypothetical protein VMT65_12235 [Nocardia sp. CDC153]|uniref:hypothetical protein n=1 Tax=Nocardia sp. CDC153 TaxID=3112167 RepID=UPI002DBC29D5|nr:hypothetical protein [Nocardia sp. CDC153]MEC3953799.1 hypothetical protein [Nocardia sp. CDC153]
MIMHGTEPTNPHPLLIIVDGRGGTSDAEAVEHHRRALASRLGIAAERIELWPTAPRPDLWSLRADRLTAVLKALISEPEPPDGATDHG